MDYNPPAATSYLDINPGTAAQHTGYMDMTPSAGATGYMDVAATLNPDDSEEEV